MNEELDLWELLDALLDEPDSREIMDKIRELITTGNCDVNTEAPISLAVCTGKLEAVKLLVEAGADVNHMDPDDFETPLFRAKDCGFQDIVEYLEPLTSPENREVVESMMEYHQKHK